MIRLRIVTEQGVDLAIPALDHARDAAQHPVADINLPGMDDQTDIGADGGLVQIKRAAGRLRKRISASRSSLACSVVSVPPCPVFSASKKAAASGVRISPTMIRSGRSRIAVAISRAMLTPG